MTITNKFIEDTKAVSEVVGYITSFFIIFVITSVVIVSAGPIIDSAESQSTDLPVNTNFVYLHDKVMDVQQGADVKKFETDMPAGELRQLNETQIVFESVITGETVTIKTHPLEFVTTQDEVIVYESMFITNSYADEPPENKFVHYRNQESFKSSNQTLRIPSITYTEQRSTSSSTRSRLIQFEMRKMSTENSQKFKSFDEDVNVEIDSEIPDSWVAYLNENEAFSNVEKNGDTVTAEVTTGTDEEFSFISQKMNLEFSSA